MNPLNRIITAEDAFEGFDECFESRVLGPNECVVTEAAITGLEEHLTKLADRVKYYGDTNATIEAIDEIQSLVRNLRKSAEYP